MWRQMCCSSVRVYVCICVHACVHVCAYQKLTVLIMCVSVSQCVGTFNCSCVSVGHTSNNSEHKMYRK